MKLAALIALALSSTSAPDWTAEQQQVIARIAALGETTRANGGGGDAYGDLLDPEFTRWTVGSSILNDRATWLDGVADWYEAGGRVIDGESDILEVSIMGEIASVRRIKRETLKNPDGEVAAYRTGVAEIWRRDGENGEWLLWRASVRAEPAAR